jgi:hypothetical protein|tara:strand:+ start:172 stop:336 length:165 start_codon:yes stop_codon:yes gene_type:complete
MVVDEVVVDLHLPHHLQQILVDLVVVEHQELVLAVVLIVVVTEINKLELAQLLQ